MDPFGSFRHLFTVQVSVLDQQWTTHSWGRHGSPRIVHTPIIMIRHSTISSTTTNPPSIMDGWDENHCGLWIFLSRNISQMSRRPVVRLTIYLFLLRLFPSSIRRRPEAPQFQPPDFVATSPTSPRCCVT